MNLAGLVVDLFKSVKSQLTFNPSTQVVSQPIEKGGVYDLLSDADCFILIDDDIGTVVNMNNGYMLFSGNVVSFYIRNGARIFVIGRNNVGHLFYQKVG